MTRRSSLEVKFLLFYCGNKSLNQGDTLPRLPRAVYEKSAVTMLLEFRGFLTKRAANALTNLQLCSGSGRIEIGEALSAKIFHLGEKLLEFSGSTGEFVNRGSF